MADEPRHNEYVEHNAITGEIDYRSWTDDDGILHEEYPEPELTAEQIARLDRFTGDLFEDEGEYMKRRQAQKAARATTGQGRQRKAHKPAETPPPAE